jgi:uncharacterized protein (DUF736 family)
MATSQRKKVGVGWRKTSQDGKTQFVSIVIHGGLSPDISLVMFTNGYKEGENQPDYIIYLNQPKDVSGASAQQAAKPAAGSDFPEPAGEAPDDDIPF